jgi:hypothetical protein
MYTAQDVAFYLLASAGGGAQDGEHHAVRQAVIHGVREVMQCRDWLWHLKTGSFTTGNVTVAAGAISSGSLTFSVSLADLAKLKVGRLVQSGSVFEEATRIVSLSTVTVLSVTSGRVTLDKPAKQTPPLGAATVTMQTFYDLPANLKDIDSLVTNTVGVLHCYLTPQEWQRLEINTRGAGEPYYYTIMRSDTDPDRWQIRFVGMPTNDTPVHYTYRYRPQEIRYLGYERACRDGLVTVDPSTTTTVTLTGAEFVNDIEGSVIRFGTSADDPGPAGDTTPFVRERYIQTKNSSTQLTVTEALAARSAVKYCITDVIDASPTMYTAILSAAEMWYARLVGKPANDVMAMFNRDIRLAMENDQIAPMSGRPNHSPYPTPRTMGWHSAILPDVS